MIISLTPYCYTSYKPQGIEPGWSVGQCSAWQGLSVSVESRPAPVAIPSSYQQRPERAASLHNVTHVQLKTHTYGGIRAEAKFLALKRIIKTISFLPENYLKCRIRGLKPTIKGEIKISSIQLSSLWEIFSCLSKLHPKFAVSVGKLQA